MATRSASWSRPAEGRLPAVLAAVVAIGLFLAAWSALHRDFFLHAQISDLPVYESYGGAMQSQLAEASERSGPGELAALLRSAPTWSVG